MARPKKRASDNSGFGQSSRRSSARLAATGVSTPPVPNAPNVESYESITTPSNGYVEEITGDRTTRSGATYAASPAITANLTQVPRIDISTNAFVGQATDNRTTGNGVMSAASSGTTAASNRIPRFAIHVNSPNSFQPLIPRNFPGAANAPSLLLDGAMRGSSESSFLMDPRSGSETPATSTVPTPAEAGFRSASKLSGLLADSSTSETFARRSRRLRENKLSALKRMRVMDSEDEDDEDHSADAMLALTLQQDEFRQAENEAPQGSLHSMNGDHRSRDASPYTAAVSRLGREVAGLAAAREAVVNLVSTDDEDNGNDVLSSPLTSVADEDLGYVDDPDFTLPAAAAQPTAHVNAEENEFAAPARRGRNYNYRRRRQNAIRRYERIHPVVASMWRDLEEMPVIETVQAPQPSGISRMLKPFQLEGLNWMIEQEKTRFKGGLLGDEMGMGKTIQAVSLIMSDFPSGNPTLVVMPPVAMKQWEKEIQAYTDGKLKVHIYGGTTSKNISQKELEEYNVIIISYPTLETAYRAQIKGTQRSQKKGEGIKVPSRIHQIHYHRVILDEAHSIKSRTTNTAKACYELKADYRWCLSGTPLQNRIGEFHSLLRFLRIQPFAGYLCKICPCLDLSWTPDAVTRVCTSCDHMGLQHISIFNSQILVPIINEGNTGEGAEAFRKLRLLTSRVMLRRVKSDHVGSMELPAKDVCIRNDFFGDVERDFASSVMSNTNRQFDTYVAQGVLLNNYANIFGLIMQMRQVADHPDILLRRNGAGGQNLMVCSICDEPAEDAIRSACHHDFCRSCVKAYVKSFAGTVDEPACPRCHIPLAIDLEQEEREQDAMAVKKTSIVSRISMDRWVSSTKIEMLISQLAETRVEKRTIKCIIFSQFTSMLQLVAWRLRQAGFDTVILDGSMTQVQRQCSINHFMTNPEAETFLVSLKAGGVALNLTEASHVYIVDPWWNPAAEWQSADRCHRIGQGRDCTIQRLVIEDSIESRMVLLQEKKSRMIRGTINADDAAIQNLTQEDMQFLFRGQYALHGWRMNAQDPFGLRKKFALPGARVIHAHHSGLVEQRPLPRTVSQNNPQQQQHYHGQSLSAQRERAGQEIPLTEDGDGGNDSDDNTNNNYSNMSFTVPKNVPSFTNPQRQLEDSSWGSLRSASGGRSAVGGSSTGPGPGQRMGGLFERRELPMYKDKPYSYGAASRRRRQWWRLKRSWLAGALVFVALLYWLGLGSLFAEQQQPPSALSSTRKRPSGFLGWLGLRPTAPVVDWDERREAVKDAFLASWDAYERHAWGYDEFYPISKKGRHMVDGGLGWIIVDSLDTLMIMNLTSQLRHAREWLATSLDYDKDHEVNTFETTIRMLGGLLSAHYLSTAYPHMAPIADDNKGAAGEDLYLEKATDLADRLMGAFESESGVPYASVNLKHMKGVPSHQDGGASSTSEAASLQLEFKYLAHLTGERSYWDKAERVMKVIDDNGVADGLVPIFIYATTGQFRGEHIRLGSRGDSYYEYLIKQYLQTSQQEPIYRDMWDQALGGIRKHLITYSNSSNITVLAERPNGLDEPLYPKMDHLVCFMPGTIALAVTGGATEAGAKARGAWGARHAAEMKLARELMQTCWGMYKVTPTGLGPEIAHFNVYDPPLMEADGVAPLQGLADGADAAWRADYVIKPLDAHNLQRPETVESLFYLWRITGDEQYRRWGWEMFQAFMNHTGVEKGGGYTSLDNVNAVPPTKRDNMESFWLAETLKYFYLLFSPNDLLPLDKIIINTEAHIFPRIELGRLFSTGWSRKPRDESGKIITQPPPPPPPPPPSSKPEKATPAAPAAAATAQI